jgi:hypothetical protein
MNTILTSTSGGLNAASIEPFFYSLRLSGYSDEVVVFASNISADCRKLFNKYDAKIIDCDYYGMPVLSKLAPRIKWAAEMIRRYYFARRLSRKDCDYLLINNGRYFYWREYLMSLKDKPGFVLFTDIRDVVFQTNPFSFPFQPGLSVTTESDKIKQSWCAIKALWFSAGLVETYRLASHDIVNCGTVVADFASAVKYLDLMTAHFNDRFFWALSNAIDQSFHTYIVHRKLISPIQYYNNWKGPFLTLANVVVPPKNKNGAGYLCNDDGSIVPIVHQYDRIKNLYGPGETRPACWNYLPQD